MPDQNPNKAQDPGLRKPPSTGGPRRIQPAGVQARPRLRRKSKLRKAFTYLFPAIVTGGSVAGFLGFSDLF